MATDPFTKGANAALGILGTLSALQAREANTGVSAERLEETERQHDIQNQIAREKLQLEQQAEQRLQTQQIYDQTKAQTDNLAKLYSETGDPKVAAAWANASKVTLTVDPNEAFSRERSFFMDQVRSESSKRSVALMTPKELRHLRDNKEARNDFFILDHEAFGQQLRAQPYTVSEDDVQFMAARGNRLGLKAANDELGKVGVSKRQVEHLDQIIVDLDALNQGMRKFNTQVDVKSILGKAIVSESKRGQLSSLVDEGIAPDKSKHARQVVDGALGDGAYDSVSGGFRSKSLANKAEHESLLREKHGLETDQRLVLSPYTQQSELARVNRELAHNEFEQAQLNTVLNFFENPNAKTYAQYQKVEKNISEYSKRLHNERVELDTEAVRISREQHNQASQKLRQEDLTREAQGLLLGRLSAANIASENDQAIRTEAAKVVSEIKSRTGVNVDIDEMMKAAKPAITKTQVQQFDPKQSVMEAGQLASVEIARQSFKDVQPIIIDPKSGRIDRKQLFAANVIGFEGLPFTSGRTFRQSMRAAIELKLRSATGAAAPEHEVDSYLAIFGPNLSDSDELIKRKIKGMEEWLGSTVAITDPTGALRKRAESLIGITKSSSGTMTNRDRLKQKFPDATDEEIAAFQKTLK